MDFYEEEKETVINNEFDYSNIIPTAEHIGTLVQYCENVYNQFLKLIEEDEQKNEKLKIEYKNYKYAKSYGEKFEVSIREKTYNNLDCKTYNSYIDAVNNGQLKEVHSLKINLDLDYKRGSGNNLNYHENSFTIIFKPYEIKFARKSNFNEENMNQIENTINKILQQFQKVNSIFCTK